MNAVVDTAADITIIAQRVYDKMSPRLEISTSIDVKLAGGGYSDVFAVSDLDLSEFAAIEHHIETAEALPVKQRMHRTPAVFKGEEEGYLDRMLAAWVIQLSTSDWAGAPVLIR